MDRRDFARLSALTLAASCLTGSSSAEPPSVEQVSSSPIKPVGFAPVGLGTISDIFMQGLVTAHHARLAAVVTGHPMEKGKHYASLYNLQPDAIYTYNTYAKLRDNPEVDAVYIGLPNSMHCDYTVRAAEAGKHVLCEKPMAISSAECRRMIDACRAANVKLMIAYRIWYDPTFERVLQIVKSGALGEIQSFQGQFIGQQPTGAWRLSKTLGGGGSLFDLGIYPLNAIRYLSGENPNAYTAVVSTREKGPRFAEVEQSVEFTLKFPSGIIASCGSSYGAEGQARLEIRGARGTLNITSAFNYDGIQVTGRLPDDMVEFAATGKVPFQFTLEADHFAGCVRNNATPKTPGELGLADLESIEALYKAAGTPVA